MDQIHEFEHSVDCSVPRDFAWSYWTNVTNWTLDADIESVEIDGSFSAGTRGITHSKRSGKIEWQIMEVGFGRALLEFSAPDAIARFVMIFEDAGGFTRITQRVSLTGEAASTYAGPIREGLPAGMRKLCESMEEAARASTG